MHLVATPPNADAQTASRTPLMAPPFTYKHAGKDMSYENINVLVDSIRAGFEKALATYVRVFRKHARREGWREPARKRRRYPGPHVKTGNLTPNEGYEDPRWDPAVLRDLRWLACYQYLGVTQSALAKEYGIHNPDSVRDALKRATREVGVKLRTEAKPGRPRKAPKPR
jgi:hypothetical protein